MKHNYSFTAFTPSAQTLDVIRQFAHSFSALSNKSEHILLFTSTQNANN